ncbi:PAS domain S-box-containing protein [Hymenobacter luteus]|uniref:histidine kinase n=2 Tax=Hymenobacter TaxID=89966 RepID=A0A7W9WD75_9BACT|nr:MULTISPECIES: PAS domain-containing protein [Hymenobacter]MBB4602941.1 PAS domain S-box-containing protein [Hymenobacter latericoloratus]MBB6060833.1 PAS domain S-box-containing protein [Hymenobacter luteus]
MPVPTFPVDYQKLFHALPDNFLLIAPDAAATIVDNTNSHVGVSMKSREEAVGKPFFEAYPSSDEESAAIIRESHEHVRRHRQPHTMPLIRYDLERPTEQGGGLEERYWEATHYPILDENGQLEFILQRTQDVTERYRAEQLRLQAQRELAEQQERTRFILESLPVMVWTNLPTGEADYFNPRWLEFTGREPQEILGQSWAQDVHPADLAATTRLWDQAREQGTELQLEYRLRRHDGQYRWVLVRAVPRRNAEGEVTMWVGCGTDIHDQKLMVQELLEQNEQQALLSDQAYQAFQEVQRQRETFYNLFMQTPALICILRGPEHRFEFVNPPYQRLFPNRQLVGQTVAEALPEVVEQGFIGLLDGVYTTGETFVGNEVQIELDHDDSGQLQRSYLNFTYQLFEEQGQKAGITVFAYDVTSLVAARRALENAGR